MDYINNFLKMEINLILAIQDKFLSFEDFLGLLSTFFGPTFLYLYVIPILSAINMRIYQRLLISCVTSDFINLMLKWILNEDRPFWWVQETNSYTALTRPVLYQTNRTCETSGGSPSGHMMLASCFLYVIYEELNAIIDKNVSETQKLKLKILNRISVISILAFVATSRMYFSAHFLHQCLLGSILGILVAKLISADRFSDIVSKYMKRDWLKIVICMTISVTAIYWAHKLLSGNPMKTVHLAFKHCLNPLFPSPETTVVFSAIRCIALTCGFLMNAPIEKRLMHLDLRKSIPAAIILTLLQGFIISYTPKVYKIIVFYSYTFVTYSMFQTLYLYIIPKYCSIKDTEKEKEKKN